jgi:FAD:protein FMN transferase
MNAVASTFLDEAGTTSRHTFRAMGTSVGITTTSLVDRVTFLEAVRRAEDAFRANERRFSRFVETSELSKVNTRSGSWTPVSEEFLSMVRAALDGARRTGGLFDPTVLPALVAAGYDRDFDADLAGARDALRATAPCGRWAEIAVRGNSVRLPRDVALDFGGIAKGRTVDIAVERMEGLMPWVLVEAGGDLRASGEIAPPGLDIAIEEPHDPRAELLRLRLAHGALATSSVTRRAWGLGRHHLIDPRTAVPATTGVLQATCWASTCGDAEVGSTWAIMSGRPVLDRISATLVLYDGTIITNMPWQART